MRQLIVLVLVAIAGGAAWAQGPAITVENAAGLVQVAVLGNGEANDVALAANGKLLAAATSIGVLVTETRVPDAAERLPGEFYATTVAVNPDGTRVAAGGWDFSLRVWDIVTGEPLLVTQEHGAAVNAVAYSPDGAILASAGDDHTVRLWHAESLTAALTIDGLAAVIDRLAFSRDGALLAGIGRDGVVRVWDTAGSELATMVGRNGSLRSLDFAADGSLLFGDESGLITAWNLTSGETIEVENFGVPVWDMATTDDGQVLTAGGDETLRRRTVGSETVTLELTNEPRYPLRAVAAAGDTYATASAQEITIWDAKDGTPVNRLWLPDQAVSAAFNREGDTLAVGTTDGTIAFYDAATLAVRATANPERGTPTALLALQDGRWAAAMEDGSIVVLSAEGGTVAAEWPGHDGTIAGMAATAERSVVVSAGRDATIRLTDVATGESAERERTDGQPFTSFTVDADNRRMFVGAEDGVVVMFSLGPRATRTTQRTQLDNGAHATALAVSPDGATLLVGSSDGALRAYGLPDLTMTDANTDFFGAQTGIAYGPDGSWFAVSSQDGWLRVFDAATMTQIFGTHGHTSWALGVAVSPDGGRIVTVGHDGVARVWEAAARE
jgi:WD40 repeat protein